jgi:hypothetical protein
MVFGVSIELWADQGAKAFWAPRELAHPLTLWVSLGASLFELMGLKVQRVENKRVDEFANMSDEELEAYVNGDRGLEHQRAVTVIAETLLAGTMCCAAWRINKEAPCANS